MSGDRQKHDDDSDSIEVFERFGQELHRATSRHAQRPWPLRLRRSAIAAGAAVLIAVPGAVAIAQNLDTGGQPEPSGPYQTINDCTEVMDLYRSVGKPVGYYYAPTCPSQDEVLRDIANGEPSADIARLCREAESRGGQPSTCEEFLRNRQQYLSGVAEIESRGIDLDAYRDEAATP